MASQLAEILNNYRQTMPVAGAGLSAASGTYLKATGMNRQREADDQQNQVNNYFKQRADTRAEEKSGREAELYKLEKLAGVVAAVKDNPEKWKQYQDNGDIPPGAEIERMPTRY